VRVYDYTKRLMVGKDYTVTYKNNTNANSSAGSKTVPSVVVKTKGNYEGTKTVPFQISAIDLNSTDITADDIVVAYNNKVQKKEASGIMVGN
ncbi:MAG: hypothetical protein IIX83_01845, partial [Peptococcaceae bacterium]|nr:hypothetical protein [Peptococcaceae bacterium]